MEERSYITHLYNIRQSRNQKNSQYYLVSCCNSFINYIAPKYGKHHISSINQNSVIIYDENSCLEDRESGKFEVSFRIYKGGIRLIANERISYSKENDNELVTRHHAPYRIPIGYNIWSEVNDKLVSDIFVVNIYEFEWMETLCSLGPGADIYIASVNGSFIRNVIPVLLADNIIPKSGRRNRIFIRYSCIDPRPGTYEIRFQRYNDKDNKSVTIAYVENIIAYMKE